jgi:hypothetical protein
MNRISTLFTLLFFIAVKSFSQPAVSPFNQLQLKDNSLQNGFSFIVTGHLHGASSNVSGFPASSVLANIDELNNLNADFFISLGDLFLDVNEYYISNYRKSFFSKLNMPLFNAVGNHDLSGNLYEREFGSTWFSFRHKNSLFIFLDTEKNDGSIKGEQAEFFRKEVAAAKADEQIRNVFISTHRPVWAEENPLYNKLFKDNTRTKFGANNFQSEILPLLQNELKGKNIVWFSGSLGGGAPSSFFYDQPDGGNMTFINTAIRDLKRDAVLKVSVNPDGRVAFIPVSITGMDPDALDNYNLSLWKKNEKTEEQFNVRLIPLFISQILTHRFFWSGIFSGVMMSVLLVWLGKKMFRKKSRQ